MFKFMQIDERKEMEWARIQRLKRELELMHDCINEFVATNSTLMEECEGLRKIVRRSKETSNTFKAYATSHSVIGGIETIAGLALAPVTCGVSTVLLISGALTSTLGGVAATGGKIYDTVKKQDFFDSLSKLAAERNASADRMNRQLAQFRTSMGDTFDHNLAKRVAANASDPFLVAFYKIYAMWQTNSGINDIMDILAPNASSVGLSLEFANINIQISKEALKGGMAAMALTLAVKDAVYLVRDWDKEHPTVERIDELISNLESDQNTIQSVRTTIGKNVKIITDLSNNFKHNQYEWPDVYRKRTDGQYSYVYK